jgi:hypothetical protein
MRLRVGSTLILCLFTGLTIPLAAQEKADTATSIRKLEEKWTESYKKRQIDILSSLLAEDFVITVEDGNTYSKSGYITHSADPSVSGRYCRTLRPQGADARECGSRHRGLPRKRQVQREAL